ncbi:MULTISPECIES: ROK family protein [Kitasatospora]|uniref:Putative NagC family transcriptional regulator n=1 Tax=Kitasatospora setae (strain ATCC 33774 / DSM 43861 / JCM 3304 / KCC A-0304 / NBRC 14216 / KM-6054) TaxID=452652 RepID=E4N8F5_KITSK|nr:MULTISPECIES: ROK family protein [Kitasatospora]BAJ27486.1 putative NagC family transcriptional regulator [Kitasatospora setae KM-6054]
MTSQSRGAGPEQSPDQSPGSSLGQHPAPPTGPFKPSHRRAAPDRGRTLLGPALRLIHTGQAPTRSALTGALDVTRATAGAVTGELEALGLITVDSRPAGGGRGRPSHRLALADPGPAVIAAQLHADGVSVALAGLGGRLHDPVHLPLPADTGPAALLRTAAEAGARLARAGRRRVLGAALALPNPVTEPDGTVPSSLHFAWPPGTPVDALYAAETARADPGPRARAPLPTAVANDANLAALAEHRHGAGRGARHLLLVTSGHRGVGGALVVDGRLHTGSSGLALEVGHLTVDPLGRPCACGNRGCLNAETDTDALFAAAGRRPDPDRPLLPQARALARDPHAADAVARVVDRLGLGLAGLANILNPDRIVLSGLHLDLLAAAPDRLAAVVADRCLWGRSGRIPIVPAQVAHAGLVGAAELAWEPYLDDPQAVAVN